MRSAVPRPRHPRYCYGGALSANACLLVEQRQLTAQQVAHAGMRLGGLEQTPDRIARPRRRVQRTPVTTQPCVAVDRLRARHRQQLAAPFVQLDPQAEEGLKAPSEAASRTPDAL